MASNCGGLDAQALERVLARAFSPQLARAIFRAAQKEHPDQRILLRRGTRTVANSAE
jgi:3-methyladenine DNA glycosylase AlkC